MKTYLRSLWSARYGSNATQPAPLPRHSLLGNWARALWTRALRNAASGRNDF